MVGFAAELTVEYAVPVIEGVTVAVKTVEGLACLGLKTSCHGGYAPPRTKRHRGDFQRFAPDD